MKKTLILNGPKMRGAYTYDEATIIDPELSEEDFKRYRI
jgi:hypothetical protein